MNVLRRLRLQACVRAECHASRFLEISAVRECVSDGLAWRLGYLLCNECPLMRIITIVLAVMSAISGFSWCINCVLVAKGGYRDYWNSRGYWAYPSFILALLAGNFIGVSALVNGPPDRDLMIVVAWFSALSLVFAGIYGACLLWTPKSRRRRPEPPDVWPYTPLIGSLVCGVSGFGILLNEHLAG